MKTIREFQTKKNIANTRGEGNKMFMVKACALRMDFLSTSFTAACKIVEYVKPGTIVVDDVRAHVHGDT